jgi:hypothetical protein
MRSLRLVYDAEGDILDVDFRFPRKASQHGIELHENIVLWTDTRHTQTLRLLFLSYTRLCEQSALTLTKLKKLPVRQQTQLLRLLMSEPVKRFLVPVDEKKLRFRVVAPGVKEVAVAA